MTEQQKPVIASPWLPSQLRDLADERTEEEGGPRDSDWMADAVLALRDSASQIEQLTWAGHLVPNVTATGQPYRVIADRDRGDDIEAVSENFKIGDRGTYEVVDTAGNAHLIRIERPVPTNDEHCTGGDDCTAPTHVHGCFADDGSCSTPDEHKPSLSLPTREQIAAAMEPDPADRDWQTVLYADRVLALLQKGADR